MKERRVYRRWLQIPLALAALFSFASISAAQSVTWTKYTNAVPTTSDVVCTLGQIPLGSASKGDKTHVIYPCVMKDDNTYRMWYSGNNSTNYRIYCATSYDGLNWFKLDNSTPTNSNTTCTGGRIPLGSGTTGDRTNVYCCSVLKDAGVYKMWYSGMDPGAGGAQRIYYATSYDAVAWTKYDNSIQANSSSISTNGGVPLGLNGSGDDAGVFNPCVIKDDGAYRMWYNGNNGGTICVYYATSPDGLTWTKVDNSYPSPSDSTNVSNGSIPLGTNTKGDDYYTRDAHVVKIGNTYRMWYSGYDSANYRIYEADSPDGIAWTKVTNAAPGNSNTTGTNGRLGLGTSGGDTSHVLSPMVILEGDMLKMWYSGHDGANYRIYHATYRLSPPVVSNAPVQNMTQTNAALVASLVSTGWAPTEVYAYWGGTNFGTNAAGWAHTNSLGTNGTGFITNMISGLSPNTLYYFTFYATNGFNGGWPTSSLSFWTLAIPPPVISNTPAQDISPTSAVLVASLVSTGWGPCEVYTYWGGTNGGTNAADWANTNYLGTNVAGFITNTVTGLSPSTLYYFTFFATNVYNGGWPTSSLSFATLGIPPPVITNMPAESVGQTNAALVASLISTGWAPCEVYSYWGTTNGGTNAADWSHTNYLGTNGVGLLTNALSGLLSNTVYYFTFYTTNQYNDRWASPSLSFLTPGPPSLDNASGATNISSTVATLCGQVLAGTPAPDVWICWGNGNGGAATSAWDHVTYVGIVSNGPFSARMPLTAGQSWYYRCYATNACGEGWAPTQTNFDSLANVPHKWTGTGPWTSSTNWNPATVPSAGDDIILVTGSVTLASSVLVNSLVVSNGATLTFANWTTKLTTADRVWIRGKVSLPGPFTNGVMSNRVWFACYDLTVVSGGSINVDAKGYGGRLSITGVGNGAGAGASTGAGGGGYGGAGGGGYDGAGGTANGVASGPLDPGSSGGGCTGDGGTYGGHGGGAVRIEAAGLVTVNGTITANGGAGTGRAGGGAGGAIYITCDAFAGTSGVVQAEGNDSGNNGGGGAGGASPLCMRRRARACWPSRRSRSRRWGASRAAAMEAAESAASTSPTPRSSIVCGCRITVCSRRRVSPAGRWIA